LILLIILLTLLLIVIILLGMVLFKNSSKPKISKKTVIVKSKKVKSSKVPSSKVKPSKSRVLKVAEVSKDFNFDRLLKEKKHLVLNSDKLFFKLFINQDYYPGLFVIVEVLFHKLSSMSISSLPQTLAQWNKFFKTEGVDPELIKFLSKILSKSTITKENLKEVLLQGIFLKLDRDLRNLEHILDQRFALIFEQRVVALSLKHKTAHPKSFKEYIAFLNNEKILLIKMLQLVRRLRNNKNIDFINYLRKDAKKLYKGNSFVSETLLSEQFLL